MIDLRILSKRGCSAELWRKHFEGRDRSGFLKKKGDIVSKKDSKSDKIDALIEHILSRVVAGRDWNFANYSTVYAMDLIWDAPFRAVSPTLISAMCQKHGNNTEEVNNVLKSLGLDLNASWIDSDQLDPKTGKPIKVIDPPTFIATTVPLVRAYMTARKAKIVNDRNKDPLIEYRAATQSNMNRARCEVTTSRINESAKAYDYLSAIDQGVFQMFLYPAGGLMFTKEEWDTCKQLRYEGEGKEPKEYVEREGLRYHLPHPSRTFCDISHAKRTFNTDTGCKYAGHWGIFLYGDIFDNEGFYNRDKISFGNTSWFNGELGASFLRTVYNTCTLKFPTISAQTTPGSPDREQMMDEVPYYTQDMRDKGVMLCEYREKLNPKQWGLGDYDHDVWCRFVVAGDGTIVYAAPMGYVPVVSFKDNGDDKRVNDASLALLLAPFQDQMSNLLTQFLLAAKSNLANMTLLDDQVVNADTRKKLQNFGEAYFRGHNFGTFDSKKLRNLQVNPHDAIVQMRFAPLDTNGIVLAMKLVLDMAERVLQFSSQEIAQAASHEQTKAEVDHISSTTNNILDYTAWPVDMAMKAMANQNYEALVNYGEDEFWAQIPSDHALTVEALKKLDITLHDDDGEETRDKKIRVKATKKTARDLDSFAIVTPTNKRETNWEAAQAMAVWVNGLNPMVLDALGPKQLIDIANQIAKLAGLRLEQPLRDATEETQKNRASDLLKQTVDTVLGIIRTETKQALEVVMSENKDQEAEIQTLTQQMGAITQALGIAPNAANPTNPPVVQAGVDGPPDMAPQPPIAPVPPAAPIGMPVGAI